MQPLSLGRTTSREPSASASVGKALRRLTPVTGLRGRTLLSGLGTAARRRGKDAAARLSASGLLAPSGLALHGVVRYEPVLRLIRKLNGGELLEVGSADSGLVGYGFTESSWSLTVLDKSFDNYGQASGRQDLFGGARRVVGDARALPFESRSFDVTVALDLLEHVAPSDRSCVLNELARVTKRRLIVGCPTGPLALSADRRLLKVYADNARPVPGWLPEHLEYGLPDEGDLRSVLEPFGTVETLPNEHLAAHERIMRIHIRFGGSALLEGLVRVLATAMRARLTSRPLLGNVVARALLLLRGFDRPPTYRTIVVLDKED